MAVVGDCGLTLEPAVSIRRAVDRRGIRSSYKAGEYFIKSVIEKEKTIDEF